MAVAMSTGSYGFLPCAVVVGDDVIAEGLPVGTNEVLARTAFGKTSLANVSGSTARVSGLPIGTHLIEALSADGEVLAEDFVSVGRRSDRRFRDVV